MEKVFFKPWVGDYYESGGIFEKKILILGDYFRCGEKCPDCGNGLNHENCRTFATDVVRSIMDGEKAGWTPTFRKFESALLGSLTSVGKSREIWNSVAFTNYLQIAAGSSRTDCPAENYNMAAPAFFELLELLRPDIVIAWGKRLYAKMPRENFKEESPVTGNGCSALTGNYTVPGGSIIPVMWIQNPASAFSWKKWHTLINQFINS